MQSAIRDRSRYLYLRWGRHCRQSPVLCRIDDGVVGQKVDVRLGLLHVCTVLHVMVVGSGRAWHVMTPGHAVANAGVGVEDVVTWTSGTRVGHARTQKKVK